MFVVIQEDHYGQEDMGYVVSRVFGPYPEEEAESVAERLRALDLYAVEFRVVSLTLNTSITA